MDNVYCYLCYTPGQDDVDAVEMSPYGYAVCMSHYRSDFNEFVRDYSQQVLDIPPILGAAPVDNSVDNNLPYVYLKTSPRWKNMGCNVSGCCYTESNKKGKLQWDS